MAEYIEREAAKRYLAFGDACPDGILDLLDEIPAADVSPVVRGRWIEADDGDGVVCSECGTDFCTLIYRRYDLKYCICGAHMKDGE